MVYRFCNKVYIPTNNLNFIYPPILEGINEPVRISLDVNEAVRKMVKEGWLKKK